MAWGEIKYYSYCKQSCTELRSVGLIVEIESFKAPIVRAIFGEPCQNLEPDKVLRYDLMLGSFDAWASSL